MRLLARSTFRRWRQSLQHLPADLRPLTAQVGPGSSVTGYPGHCGIRLGSMLPG